MSDRWRLIKGEALAELQKMPDASVDAIITDPPYSSGGFTRGDRTATTTAKYVQTGTQIARPDFAGDNRDQRSFEYWCVLWLSECLRVAKPGSPICVFTDWRQLPATTDAVQAGGWVWRGIVVWDKGPAVRPVMGRFVSQCEYVIWGTAGGRPVTGAEIEEIGRLPGVINQNVVQADKHHITGKPTAVMQELVRICPVGGLVLDPFCGSSSTGVGALLEGRRFLGIEMAPAYLEIGRERLAAADENVSLDAYRAKQVPLFGAP